MPLLEDALFESLFSLLVAESAKEMRQSKFAPKATGQSQMSRSKSKNTDNMMVVTANEFDADYLRPKLKRKATN